MIKGNKGEWSELYVFVKLLSEGKLYQSDINLNRDSNNFYEVVKAYREDGTFNYEYERNTDICLYSVSDQTRNLIQKFSIGSFSELSENLYKNIINGKGKAFEIPSMNGFFKNTGIKKLTSKSTLKSDIKLRIYDHRLAKEADLGFSIKSLLGGNSTLFNTGVGNNFIYKVITSDKIPVSEFNAKTYKPIGNVSKLTYRLKLLLENYSSNIKFHDIQSSQLMINLRMVDGDLPKILAFCLFYRWVYKMPELNKLANFLEEEDPLNFYNGKHSNQRLYEYKLKKFLAESAMGMTSETPWQGIYDATGGVIFCKEDGDIVCFHIYDFNLFRDYLLNNTKLEQPSTGENENIPGTPRDTQGTKKYFYGWLYEENENLYFKINLQVRFT